MMNRYAPPDGRPQLKEGFVKSIRALNKTYGDSAISFIADAPHLQKLFKPGLIGRAVKHYPRGAIDPIPHLLSIQREQLNNLEELAQTLNKAFPRSVDDMGRVFGNGVRSDFNGLLHLAGMPQERATTPSLDNKNLRAERGLVNEWSSKFDRDLFKAVVVNFFKELPDVKVRIKDRTSSGFGDFSTDLVEKLATFHHYMDNLDHIIKLINANDIETAYKLYELMGPSFTVFRDQPGDKVSIDEKGIRSAKLRRVATPEYAISGGASGSMVDSSKDPAVWGLNELSGRFFTLRRRVAYAQSKGYSFLLLPWAQSIRKSVYERYEFTMHHTTDDQKREKIAPWDFAIPVDVSDHDLLWPVDLYVPVIEEALNELGYESWAIKLFVNALRTAIYVPSIADGEGGFMVGDWRDPQNSTGLVSGNPFTDIAGSVGMIFCYLLTQLKHTLPQVKARLETRSFDELLSWVDGYLKGNQIISAPSKSDDAYLLWKQDLTSVQLANKLMIKMKEIEAKTSKEMICDYMIISYEDGGAFLGSVAIYPASKDMSKLIFTGNANSLPVRLYQPEYACKMSPELSPSLYEADRLKMMNRAYPMLAHYSRQEKYGSMPAYVEMMDIIKFCWRKHLQNFMGMSYDSYMEKYAREHTDLMKRDLVRRLQLGVARGIVDPRVMAGQLTSIEMEYVNEPSIVTWKYRDTDVDETLQDMHFGSIAPEISINYLNRLNPSLRKYR